MVVAQARKWLFAAFSLALVVFVLVLNTSFDSSNLNGASADSHTANAPGTAHSAANLAQSPGGKTTKAGTVTETGLSCTVGTSMHNDVSPPLGSIKPNLPKNQSGQEIGEREFLRLPPTDQNREAKDPVVQDEFSGVSMPTPIVNFDGNFSQKYNGGFVGVPDTNGDIGPNHYVQWVNLSFEVFKKDGTVLYGPTTGNTLWKGFGGNCEFSNDGDPISIYDSMADRWLMSQFAIPGAEASTGPSYQCVAVSTTGDPLGTWNRYAFETSADFFEDYPHFGVWPDAYYLSLVQYDGTSNEPYSGPAAVALNRVQMLEGQPADYQKCDLSAETGIVTPADLDGPTLPPDGEPEMFAAIDGFYHTDHWLRLYKFHVDWDNPDKTVLDGPISVSTASFDANLCRGRKDCIPEPNTTAKLEAISDRLMYRFSYRNFGDHESWLANHAVDADGTDHAGVRWYELRNPDGQFAVYQQGTYAPDSDNRWMGSLAMDHVGNIALGYTVASSTLMPSIRYTGRLVSDPLGTMPQGETSIIEGTGVQTDKKYERWGDYSTMSIDPVDDCTFWFTTEYYPVDSNTHWKTRIAAFRFPGCSAATAPTPTPKPVSPKPKRTPTPEP